MTINAMKHLFDIISALKTRATLFVALAIILMAADLMIFSFIIGDNSTFRLRAVLYTADMAVLLCFYWFVRPRWRWLTIPLTWIIAIFMFANALFFVYWGDMFPISAIFNTSNYNSFIFKSIPALLSPLNISLLVIPTGLTLLYFIIRPNKSPEYKFSSRLTAVSLTILLYGLGLYLSVSSTMHWRQMTDHPRTSRTDIFIERFGPFSTQYSAWKHSGLICYLITLIVNNTFTSSISLTEPEIEAIKDFIDDNSADATVGCMTDNRDKNLIFIIVESLNASVLDITHGSERLTPVLSSLAEADSTISSLSMRAQIADGGSSDGQLIYNTGLLPLLSGAAAQIYGENDYPSIVKAIRPASSAEFIVESSAVYNHRNTSIAFGYETLHDSDSLLAAGYDVKKIGSDEAVLNYAFDRIQHMPQPFVAEITTLSMHFPFDLVGFEPRGWVDSLSNNMGLNRYYQTTHYTDAAIGHFLNRLKESELADNTIVVIASDHDCNPLNVVDQNDRTVDFPIVFIAIGTGQTLHYTGPMGQVDVFPTILDIMGVPTNQYAWRGLGKSILSSGPAGAISRSGQTFGNPDPKDLLRLERAFSVSDTLIRSNFFRPDDTAN